MSSVYCAVMATGVTPDHVGHPDDNRSRFQLKINRSRFQLKVKVNVVFMSCTTPQSTEIRLVCNKGSHSFTQACPQDVKSQDRDETETFQKRIDTTVSQSKTPTGDVCHLTTCFMRVRSIIFFVIYPQA